MKHNLKITTLLLGMFLITQIIGLLVINAYSPINATITNPANGTVQNITIQQPLPYGFQPPETEATPNLISILISFIIAIAIILILIKYKFKFVIKTWFFVVIIIALAIAINALLKSFTSYAWLISLIITVPLAWYKIYKPHFLVHNLTELLIYPGIAAVFVPVLNVWTVLILLILISIYDMWAVWHSKVMIKMAKFQMDELKVFGGFFIPYASKKVQAQIKKLKKSKSNKGKKIKISLAILGGGDVVFPIITAGVFLRAFGLVPALFVTAGATLALLLLFMRSEKKKFYPAMPFITAGIFAGLLVWKVLSVI